MTGIAGADHIDHTPAFNHLAVFASALYRRSHFHSENLHCVQYSGNNKTPTSSLPFKKYTLSRWFLKNAGWSASPCSTVGHERWKVVDMTTGTSCINIHLYQIFANQKTFFRFFLNDLCPAAATVWHNQTDMDFYSCCVVSHLTLSERFFYCFCYKKQFYLHFFRCGVY